MKEGITFIRSAAIDKMVRKYLTSIYLHRKIALPLSRILSQTPLARIAHELGERSPPGHIMYSEEAQQKILESDNFCTLESEGVTELGALYKVSPSELVLFLVSKTAKEKFAGTEIQCRFGDPEICLNFRKTVSTFRNGEACYPQFRRSSVCV